MNRSLALGSAILLAILCPNPLPAQYLYMDSNGNGIHDSGDRVKKNGPTEVDIYLNTAANRDGSPVACDNDDPDTPGITPLQMFSFSLGLQAVGGTVSWNSFTEVPPGFVFLYSCVSTPTDHHLFYAISPPDAVPWLDPGLHHLGRLEITVNSGSPSLRFAPTIVCSNGFNEYTSFGSPCMGLDFDNTYKLGSDFQDNDGLAAQGPPPPQKAVLSPNPFNPSGKLSFGTTAAGHVRVRIFDVSGRLVRTAADESMAAGPHEVLMDGRNDGGGALGSGVYFYRIESVDGSVTGRLTISR